MVIEVVELGGALRVRHRVTEYSLDCYAFILLRA